MQIGALTAFLSYLMQILMAVMMATFMFMMIPRAEVCAERIEEVLDTESSVVPPAGAGHARDSAHGCLELRDVEFRYPGAEEPVLRGVDLTARPGETTAVIGSTGSGKTHAAQPGAPAVRRHRRRRCWSTASTCASSTRTLLSRTRRAGAAEAVPVLRHRRLQPALRQAGRHRRGAVAGAGGRAGPRLRRADARRPGRADRPGRHQRLRRPAAAPGHRPGAGAAGRRSTSSTTRSRRWTTPPTRRCARRWPGRPPTPPWSSSPSGSAPSATPTGSSCSTRAAVVGTGTHAELMADQRDLPGDRALPAHRAGGRRMTADADDQRRRPAPPMGGRPGPDDDGRHAGREAAGLQGLHQAAAAACCGRSASLVGRVLTFGVASVALSVLGPEDPRPRHRPHLRRRRRRGHARRHQQGPGGRAAAGRGRQRTLADMLAAMDVVPGQGIDFTPLGQVLLLGAGDLPARLAASAWSRAG